MAAGDGDGVRYLQADLPAIDRVRARLDALAETLDTVSHEAAYVRANPPLLRDGNTDHTWEAFAEGGYDDSVVLLADTSSFSAVRTGDIGDGIGEVREGYRRTEDENEDIARDAARHVASDSPPGPGRPVALTRGDVGWEARSGSPANPLTPTGEMPAGDAASWEARYGSPADPLTPTGEMPAGDGEDDDR